MSICSSNVYETPANVAPKMGLMQRSRKLMWVALVLIAVGAAAAYLLPQDLRDMGPLYSLAVCASFVLRVLRFHLSVVVGAMALVALLLRCRRMAACAGVLCLVLIWPTLASIMPIGAAPSPGPTVRVMSMNVMFNNRDASAILYQIREANPDILAIQEYTQFHDDLLKRELTDYPYRLTDPDEDISSYGMAVFSKVPMDAQLQQMQGSLTKKQIRATLSIEGRRVVLYNIHPASPQSIAAIIRNRVETAELIDELRQEHDPLIIAGDFNATETTPNLHAYDSLNLQNTHELAGFGRGSTWPARGFLKILPGFRIDHVLISPQLTCTSSFVCGPTGSDHRPIIADIAYSRN